MQVRISRPVRLKARQTARISGRLPAGLDRATIEVWSSEGGAEFSPHVPAYKAKFLSDGKPVMVQPTDFRLIRGHRDEATIEVTADEATRLVLVQDKDGKSRPSAKVSIVRIGSFADRAQRLLATLRAAFRKPSHVKQASTAR